MVMCVKMTARVIVKIRYVAEKLANASAVVPDGSGYIAIIPAHRDVVNVKI